MQTAVVEQNFVAEMVKLVDKRADIVAVIVAQFAVGIVQRRIFYEVFALEGTLQNFVQELFVGLFLHEPGSFAAVFLLNKSLLHFLYHTPVVRLEDIAVFDNNDGFVGGFSAVGNFAFGNDVYLIGNVVPTYMMGKSFPLHGNADAFEHTRHNFFGNLERIGYQAGNFPRGGVQKTVAVVGGVNDNVVVITAGTVATSCSVPIRCLHPEGDK